ncbi:MAG TPA: fibronectin type III domain-containing protein [Kofleriaceae bacterium]|nr:fibronectin type III domain-containing protein [Kofleriaceae bacterium]
MTRVWRPRLAALAAVLAAALALAAAACGTRAEDPAPPAYDDIQRIFDQSCAGAACHRSPTAAPPASIDLGPGVSYAHLVRAHAAAAPGRLLVDPGAPDDSYLVCTLDPACDHRIGQPMPPLQPVAAETLEAVRRWIAAGAPPDDSPAPPPDAGDDPPVFAGLTSATATGEHTVDLAWSPAFDRTPPSRLRYRVYVGDAPGAEELATPRLTVTAATRATIDGLAAGARHVFVVRAVDEADHEDGNTVEREADTPDLTPPDFGGATAVTESAPGTLDVTWAAATDNATPAASIAYRVYVATTAGAESFASPTATVTGVTHATLPGVTPSTTFFVVVRARDAAGNEDANALERSVTTLDTVAPTFAGVATADPAPNAVVLGWSAASDDATPAAELTYLVYRATSAGAEDFSNPTYVTPPGATTFSAGGLLANRTYFFVVRARDAAGNVDANVVQRSATTPALVDVQPPAFAGVTSATAAGDSSIRLTWDAGTDNLTLAGNLVYRIYRATSPGSESFAAPTYVTAPGATSFVATGLAPLTPYVFVVRAVDQAGNHDGNTVERGATTTADGTPPVFAGLTGAAPAGSSSITLAWNPATDDLTPAAALVYDVYRATTAGAESFAQPTYTSAPGATGLVATGLAPSTTYAFVVRARDAAGNDDTNTVERTATTTADVTPPVFAGAASAAPTASAGELDVTWNAGSDNVTPPEQLRYLVYTATSPGLETFTTPAALSAPGATAVRLTGLLASTPYFVVVRARDGAGNVDGNLVERSATTTADTLAPTFTGVTTATALNPGHVRLTWAEGSDDLTPRADLVYDVYAATHAGGENFAAPTMSSPPGADAFTVGGLTPATTWFFVVRARDQSGNHDGNTVERSATTPPITVTFSTQVAPVLAASCAANGCHAPPFPELGLDLSNGAAARAQTIGVLAAEVNIPRVTAGDSSSGASYLMAKLRGGGPLYEGSVMPPPPASPLTAQQLQTIATWIDEGAVDN